MAPDSRPRKILIIEDEGSIRDMMKSVLEIEGYAVLATRNGEEGIHALQEGTLPDAILLDMMMPVKSGWDFLDYLRASEETKSIPFVVVSAYDEIARSVQPNAFVPKPVQLGALLAALEKCVA